MRNQTVQVGVSWALDVQVTTADIVQCLVVYHKCNIRVLKHTVGAQCQSCRTHAKLTTFECVNEHVCVCMHRKKCQESYVFTLTKDINFENIDIIFTPQFNSYTNGQLNCPFTGKATEKTNNNKGPQQSHSNERTREVKVPRIVV